MKKTLVLGLLAAALSATPLFAADMAQRAPVYKAAPAAPQLFNWNGFYIGGYAGWMNAKSHEDSTSNVSLNGGAFGGLMGFNLQTNNFVWGLEADGGLSTADRGDNFGVGGNMQSFRDRFIGNVRLRAGLAYDRALFFIAGGAAFTDERVVHSGGASDAQTRTGWTIGGGVDYAATQNTILRLEYLRAGGFGDKTYNFGHTHVIGYDDQNTVRGAVIWKW